MGSAHFTLLTSTFTAGVDNTRAELRVPTIKGQLRWWTRAILGNGRPEYALFGGIKGKRLGFREDPVSSPYFFRLVSPNFWTGERYLCPHPPAKGPRQAVLPSDSGVFELHWFFRLPSRAASAAADLERVIKAWMLLGSVGCRSNRAAGSVWPAGYEPTVAEFEHEITALNLPPEIKVRVLGKPIATADNLRAVATNTLKGHPPQTENIHGLGDVLGYVEGRQRKASALKLKVGRFSDDCRLIAVFDLRNGRATARQFTDAANQLAASGKALGRDLTAALTAAPL